MRTNSLLNQNLGPNILIIYTIGKMIGELPKKKRLGDKYLGFLFKQRKFDCYDNRGFSKKILFAKKIKFFRKKVVLNVF